MTVPDLYPIPHIQDFTPSGLFKFLRILFRLRNTEQTFNCIIDQMLWGLHFCYVYIDDILTTSATAEEHQEHLRLLFAGLQNFGIVINTTKYIFGVLELHFLGQF